MLLESHSQIGFCVVESRRIDVDRREGYCLAGNGDGPHGGPNECMLDRYVSRHFRGEISASELIDVLQYSMSQCAATVGPIRDKIAQLSRAQFNAVGLALPEKRPRFLLFQGHSGPKYEVRLRSRTRSSRLSSPFGTRFCQLFQHFDEQIILPCHARS